MNLETIILSMLGEHQKQNAALAITVIELNEQGLIELDFNKMIDGYIESVRWTGRIEQVHDKPLNYFAWCT